MNDNYFLQQQQDVEELSLNDKGVYQLPDDVFSRFTNLKSLNLSHCSLETLPSSLFNIQSLESLDISDNDFSFIPVEIGCLKSLTKLNFSDNPFKNSQYNDLYSIDFFKSIMSEKNKPAPRVFDPLLSLPNKKYFKLVSYNILAPQFVNSSFFPFSPQKYLDSKYRIPLIKDEIVRLTPDIVCLQEVDENIFQNDLNPFFTSKNFTGVFFSKSNTGAGQATFIHKNSFVLVGSHTLELRTHRLASTLSNYNELSRHLSCAVITLLKSYKHDIYIVVVNIHLYYKREAHEIRTSQLYLAIMAAIEFAHSKEIFQYDIIISGDFNSTLDQQPLIFLQNNTIDRFFNSYQVLNHNPEITRYDIINYSAIDFIFSTIYGIQPVSVLPVDTENIKNNYAGLPGQYYPSDHSSIATIFEFKSRRFYPPPRYVPPSPVAQEKTETPKNPDLNVTIVKPNKDKKIVFQLKKH
ncbi:hypothetical protein M9Y10_020079 [Tritrichomonas musculus]|uniref:Endonuclease/exonuclease/phosphatase domain-containing protein n=1 Tax=Tritrichomonas musculus TaxID=1915356 RepID=A0ABR2HG52_9EUKA